MPLSAMKDVQDKLNALSAQVHGDKVNDLIQTALSDGRFCHRKRMGGKLGKSDITALSDYLAVAPESGFSGRSSSQR